MSIIVKGKIWLDGAECCHCGDKVLNGNPSDKQVCSNCGAKYNLKHKTLTKDNIMECEFDFVGFNCIQSSLFDICDNSCPAPYMYCREHSDDLHIKKAEGDIIEAEKKVEEAKDKLESIKKSKKTWLVSDLSGINNE